MGDAASETDLPRREDDAGDASMTVADADQTTLEALDAETTALVWLAAVLSSGSEADIRTALTAAVGVVRVAWVEEVILQTYLFAGFPRALNAAREWRRISGEPAPAVDGSAIDTPSERQARGEVTCSTVYGPFYHRLRVNIAALHPALDRWMVEEGYGKVLSRAPLDLARRELCIVATCAVAKQDRQLHSHLHGALHAGASEGAVSAALDVVASMLTPDDVRRYRGLWARVRGK
ncbi:MAG: carboxymuconolactone decarboxylase family protein [Gemmatimonas sp.]|jgi:4-carboxymuconolactone decarboxylase|uniref:carboxymuconolactone decarboxylase family protein n=1 Tax=Gemmatimonas sp. TaxID=1962908 RepID=UPI00391F6A50|nr:carboxymuconolactone decarboxylase family protein [Gemmatimonadota bacterium]